MLMQPWLNADWEKADPKLREVQDHPALLPHTQKLCGKIPLTPAGILLLRGPRQVGKSTFLRQLAVKVLAEKLPPENLLLIEAEHSADWRDLADNIERFVSGVSGYSVILIDELTAVPKWWLSMKTLADQGKLRDTLVLGTGSSAEDLAQGADLLPGRRGRRHPVDFELLPLGYADVAARLEFNQYLLTGGFPWAINEFLRLGFIPGQVYELHAGAISGSFHKRRAGEGRLGVLLHYIAERQGTALSVQGLCRDCDLGANRTGEEYIDLLDRIYSLLPCYWAEPQGEPMRLRKGRKFYAADPFLFHIFAEMGRTWDNAFPNAEKRLGDPALVGRMVEGVVAAELRRRHPLPLKYWSGNKEIDFIGESYIEVKYRNQVSSAEFAWAEAVIPKGKRLLVLTKDMRGESGRIRLMPLEQWLIEIPAG
jgi:uncharacterized protein